jgi:hypothetical protein
MPQTRSRSLTTPFPPHTVPLPRTLMKKRLWIMALALGVPLVALLVTFFYISGPRWAEADYDNTITYDYLPGPENPETLTVATYNVGYLSGLTNQQAVVRDRALLDANQATAISALQGLNLDVLALQEVDFDAHRSFNLNQQYALSEALALPFAALAVNWDKRYVPFPYWPPQVHYKAVTSGQAVLSRYPIRDNQRLVLGRTVRRNHLNFPMAVPDLPMWPGCAWNGGMPSAPNNSGGLCPSVPILRWTQITFR